MNKYVVYSNNTLHYIIINPVLLLLGPPVLYPFTMWYAVSEAAWFRHCVADDEGADTSVLRIQNY